MPFFQGEVGGDSMMSPYTFFIKLTRKIRQYFSLLHRNAYNTRGERIISGQINLEWVPNGNLGDELAPIIYDWMLERKGINKDVTIRSTYHLMTIGSMVGSWNFDSVIWGSGIHLFSNVSKLYSLRRHQKLDIRAVRGPITRKALLACGHDCPEIYGDPAVLIPLIYTPARCAKKYKISIVLHYHADLLWENEVKKYNNLNCIRIDTKDYKHFISEILSSEKIISSSLHGIILSEAYGVPAVFLNTGEYVDDAFMKYYDWYFSTGRFSVKVARSLDEAVRMTPMELPNLEEMQVTLLNSFPYDLWEVQETVSPDCVGGMRDE